MQAQVFPYMPPSVLCELGDQQRLRMLTARVGSPKDLVNLNRVLGHPSLTARGSSPRTRLALILTAYLVQKTARSERRGWPCHRRSARRPHPVIGSHSR
jgi:hypothetical protein